MRELILIAEELYRRPEIEEVIINFTSARITVVLSPDYTESLLKEAVQDEKSFYGRFGLLKELSESEFENGVFEITLSTEKKKLEDLEYAVEKRGDEVTGIEVLSGDLRVKILLRSSSIERVVGPLMEEFKGLGFIVEYAGAELEASKTAIFAAPQTSNTILRGVSGFTSAPMRYRVYLDLCMSSATTATRSLASGEEKTSR